MVVNGFKNTKDFFASLDNFSDYNTPLIKNNTLFVQTGVKNIAMRALGSVSRRINKDSNFIFIKIKKLIDYFIAPYLEQSKLAANFLTSFVNNIADKDNKISDDTGQLTIGELKNIRNYALKNNIQLEHKDIPVKLENKNITNPAIIKIENAVTNDNSKELQSLMERAIINDNSEELRNLLQDPSAVSNIVNHDNKESLLIYAVRNKKISCATILAKKISHEDIDYQDDTGATALYIACKEIGDDNLELIKLLISCGANVDAVDNEGYTPLMKAIFLSPMCANLLLDEGANANIQEKEYGTTALILLCFEWDYAYYIYDDDNLEKVQNFITKLVDASNVNITDTEGNTALHYSIKESNYFLADMLLKAGANANIVNENGLTPLMMAEDNDIDVVKKLIKGSSNTP